MTDKRTQVTPHRKTVRQMDGIFRQGEKERIAQHYGEAQLVDSAAFVRALLDKHIN